MTIVITWMIAEHVNIIFSVGELTFVIALTIPSLVLEGVLTGVLTELNTVSCVWLEWGFTGGDTRAISVEIVTNITGILTVLFPFKY